MVFSELEADGVNGDAETEIKTETDQLTFSSKEPDFLENEESTDVKTEYDQGKGSLLDVVCHTWERQEDRSVDNYFAKIHVLLVTCLGRKGDYIEWKEESLMQDEEMTVTLEDLSLLYVLTLIHPQLPVYIRDIFSRDMGRDKRLMDYKTEIFTIAQQFITNMQGQDKTTNGDTGIELQVHRKRRKETKRTKRLTRNKLVTSEKSTEREKERDAARNTEALDYLKMEISEEPVPQSPQEELKEESKEEMPSPNDLKSDLPPEGYISESANEDEKYPNNNDLEDLTVPLDKPKESVKSKRRKPGTYNGEKYKCDSCDYEARWRYKLKQHKERKHLGVRYPCDQCDYQATTKIFLKQHVESKHQGVRFPCDQCGRIYTNSRNLLQHVQVKHEGKVFMCDQCSFTASFKHLLDTHIKIKHEQVKFKCHLCEVTLKNKVRLRYHMKDEHGDFDIDLSSVNNTNSTESTTTTAAVEQHHCEQCTYKTSLASALTYHMSARHGVGEYPCGKCDFMAATPAMLKSHKAKHDRTLHCDQCAYEAKREFMLKKHMSIKHGVGNFPCEECGFAAHNELALKQHAAKHGIFPCDKCEFVATLKSVLTDHVRNTHEDRKYSCDHCEYTSTRADVIRTHTAAMHEGTKCPCNLCDYVAKRPGDLYKHKRFVHKS